MRELLRLAAERGISVHATHDLPPGWRGCWEPAHRRIWFRFSLTPAERRSTIAHELGHEFYGDTCSTDVAERRAKHYAAALLIDPAEYARLESIDDSVDGMAEAFDVTVQVIEDFRALCLKPIGAAVYVKTPRARERRVA